MYCAPYFSFKKNIINHIFRAIHLLCYNRNSLLFCQCQIIGCQCDLTFFFNVMICFTIIFSEILMMPCQYLCEIFMVDERFYHFDELRSFNSIIDRNKDDQNQAFFTFLLISSIGRA